MWVCTDMGTLEGFTAEEEKSKSRPTLNEARILSGQARSPKASNVALNLLLDKHKSINILSLTHGFYFTPMFTPFAVPSFTVFRHICVLILKQRKSSRCICFNMNLVL